MNPVSCLAQTVEIIPLGDSITEAESPYNSFRRPLFWLLQDAGIDVNFVGSQTGVLGSEIPPNPDFDADHEGHWGWTTQNMLYSDGGLASRLSNAQVEVVLLLLGANDLRQCRGVDATLLGLADIILALRGINPDVAVLVGALLPISGTYCQVEISTLVDEVNAALPGMLMSLSSSRSPLLLVDLQRDFSLMENTYDGIHPNFSGELKVAREWFDTLVILLFGTEIHTDSFE